LCKKHETDWCKLFALHVKIYYKIQFNTSMVKFFLPY